MLRIHLHWRNLRLELSADNWIQLVEAFEAGIAKWRAHGSPRSHPHLELAKFLMDTSEVIHPTTANAELCENLYKTLRETHGADAEFWSRRPSSTSTTATCASRCRSPTSWRSPRR